MNTENSPLLFTEWHENLQVHVVRFLTMRELANFSTVCKSIRKYVFNNFLNFHVECSSHNAITASDILQVLESKRKEYLGKVYELRFYNGGWSILEQVLTHLPNIKILRTGFNLKPRPPNCLSLIPTSLHALEIVSSENEMEDFSRLTVTNLVLRDGRRDFSPSLLALPTKLLHLEISSLLMESNFHLLAKCSQLTSLKMQRVNITGKELQFLPTELRHLDMWFCPNLKNIEYLTRLKKLTSLDLTTMPLAEESILFLPPKITKLILYELPTVHVHVPNGVQNLEISGKIRGLENVVFPTSVTILNLYTEIPVPLHIPSKLQVLKVIQHQRPEIEWIKLFKWIGEFPMTLHTLVLKIKITTQQGHDIKELLCSQKRSIRFRFDSLSREIKEFVIYNGKVASSK